MNLDTNEVGVGAGNIINGLNATQAQQLAEAFQAITSLPGEKTNSQFADVSNGAEDYYVNSSANLASGEMAGFSTVVWGGGRPVTQEAA